MQPGFVKILLKCSKFDSKNEKPGKIAKTLLKRSKTCPTCQNCKGVGTLTEFAEIVDFHGKSLNLTWKICKDTARLDKNRVQIQHHCPKSVKICKNHEKSHKNATCFCKDNP